MRLKIGGHGAHQKRVCRIGTIGNLGIGKTLNPAIIGGPINHLTIAEAIGGDSLKTGSLCSMLCHGDSLMQDAGLRRAEYGEFR
jgi:hypothetical protein